MAKAEKLVCDVGMEFVVWFGLALDSGAIRSAVLRTIPHNQTLETFRNVYCLSLWIPQFSSQKRRVRFELIGILCGGAGKGEATLALKEGGRAIVLTGPAEPPAFRFVVVSKGPNLELLNPFLEDGTLKPVIDTKGPFDFSELVEAFAYLEEGRASGKVVISGIA